MVIDFEGSFVGVYDYLAYNWTAFLEKLEEIGDEFLEGDEVDLYIGIAVLLED